MQALGVAADRANGEGRYHGRRAWVMAGVLLLHLLLGYALLSGMAQRPLQAARTPPPALQLQEVLLPPPVPLSPPPPALQPAPARPVPAPQPVPAPVMPAAPTPPPPAFLPAPELAPAPSAAPAVAAQATPPSAPPLVPAAQPATAAAPKPTAGTSIGLLCPVQVPPEMPRRALQDGIEGVVQAQVLIRDGVVREVTILSGPRVFHAAVRNAMLRYQCRADPGELLATQEFRFRLE